MKYLCTCVFLGLHFQPSLSYLFSSFIYHTVSRISEQCDDRWVPEDLSGLQKNLRESVFGQDLASEIILGALDSHLNKKHRNKPLVMSFHGWNGGGKSYVASFIAKRWFTKGEDSQFLINYDALLHFPDKYKVLEYQRRLQRDLEETVRLCPRAMFIFDEVDKFPPEVLEGIKPYLKYTSHVNGIDFREAIFIFISNIGENLINDIVTNNSKKRTDLKLQDFEQELKTTSFKHEGGFYRSDLIKHHLIDVVVPFLPLERKHVRSCIEAEILRSIGYVPRAVITDLINEAMDEMVFSPEGYSSSGCKTVSEKVTILAQRYLRKKRKEDSESKHSVQRLNPNTEF